MSRLSILVVCTANICRSPYVEATLERAFTQVEITGVRVSSAGTRAMTGAPIAEGTLRQLAARNITPDIEFAAKQVTSALVSQSALVLTMTREHRAQVLEITPAALRRTFTLREFAGLIEADGLDTVPTTQFAAASRDEASTEPLWEHLIRRSMGIRSQHPHLVNSELADLADPYGQNDEAFDRMASVADQAVSTVAAAIQRLG